MNPLRRIWTTTNRAVVVNAGSLVGTTVVTAGLGFIYWIVAAHGFAASAVGLASASISAMTLLGYVGMLGLGTLLMGELPHQKGREGSLVSAAVLLSGFAGFVLGLLFAAFASALAPDFRPLQEAPALMAAFAAGVALTSSSLVIDQALIGLLLGGLQLGRNAVFATVKLAALFLASLWLTQRTGVAIYLTWALGNLVSMLALAAAATALGRLRFPVRPQWAILRDLGRAALGHHALNLALQLPVLGAPIVVTVILTAAFNAYFYVAWMVAFSFVWVGPAALSFVLYTVVSKTPAALGRTIRFTLALSLAAAVISNLLVPWTGGPALRLFGASYATHAGASLQVLVLTVFPLIVKDHYVSLWRLDGRLGRAAATIGAAGVLELVGAAAGAYLGGLLGLCLGWGGVICIEALFMAPMVYRAAKGDLAPRTECREQLRADRNEPRATALRSR
jgi:O-antigen/teichoic acid export membrane protein